MRRLFTQCCPSSRGMRLATFLVLGLSTIADAAAPQLKFGRTLITGRSLDGLEVDFFGGTLLCFPSYIGGLLRSKGP